MNIRYYVLVFALVVIEANADSSTLDAALVVVLAQQLAMRSVAAMVQLLAEL